MANPSTHCTSRNPGSSGKEHAILCHRWQNSRDFARINFGESIMTSYTNATRLAVACLAFSLSASGAANSAVADAAMKGDKTALRLLIQKKADVNAPQADG